MSPRRALAVCLAVGLLLGLGPRLTSQAPPAAPPRAVAEPGAPPPLPELERLRIANAMMAVEIATLKVQAAAAELTKAREAATALLKAAEVPGWQLTTDLVYVKAPAPAGGKGTP